MDAGYPQSFLDAMTDLAYVKDAEFRYTMINRANCAYFGLSESEILGKTDFDLMPEPQARACRDSDERALREGRIVVTTETVGDQEFESRKFPVQLTDGTGVGAIIRNVTPERSAEAMVRQSEARLRTLVRILQHPAMSIQDLLDYALNEAVTLTESTVGYIYRYDEDRKQFVLNAWSKEVMPACSVQEPQLIYDLDRTGIWGEAVRQRRPIIVNDFQAPNPLKKGYPEGHVPLETFLTIPVTREDRIVATVGMGNKATGYTEADALQLTLLMDAVWNIVERLEAENAVQREKDNLTSALAAAPIAMLVFDEGERLLYANPLAERLFGQNTVTLIGHRCGDFIACDMRHTDPRGCGYTDQCALCPLNLAIKSALDSHGGDSGEALLTRDLPARPMWVTYRVNSVILDGRPCAIMALDDITRRKQTEEALIQERLLLRTVIDNIPDSIYAKDSRGRKTLANRADLDFMGVDSEREVLGKTDFELFPKSIATSFASDDQHVLTTGEPVLEREELVTDRRGNTRWLQTSKFPLRDASGRVIGLVGTGRDVTGRRQAVAERQLLLSQIQTQAEQLQHVLETVPQGVLLLSEDGHILLHNPLAERDLAALAQGEADRLTALGGQPLQEFFTSPPKGLWHEVRGAGRVFEVIARPIEKNGSPASGHWVMVINDATEERRVRDELQQQARLAAVGQLAAGIAHDFNNIMAVIILHARLTEASPALSEPDRERIAGITQQAYHASRLIEQLLDFSRSSMLDRRTLDLMPLLKEHVKLLERTLPETIAVSCDCESGEYVVEGDVTRLQQVLLNLAINARDAMPKGGALRFSLSHVTSTAAHPPLPGMPGGDWVRIAVTDTGTGIPDELLSHIFEPFQSTKAPGKGTGLGLAQVHGLVSQHQGYIGVQTASGAGTTFTIYLPAFREAAPSETQPGDEPLLHGNGETVLIVEDNAALREALHHMLLEWRYQVLVAANGHDALALLDSPVAAVDVILSDAVMPVMGGPALAHALHARGRDIPMLIMSGHAEAQPISELRAYGVRAWLSKPLQLDELARTLHAACHDGTSEA